jgi:hypothetical protein
MSDSKTSTEPNWKTGWTPELMCTARGCPNRWSVDTPDRHKLCQHHAWAPEHDWPSVTDSQWAFKAAEESQIPAPVARMSDQQKRGTVSELRSMLNARQFEQSDPKAWAKRLQERHQIGERLNPNQVRSYQAALGTPLSDGERDHIGRDGVLGERRAA